MTWNEKPSSETQRLIAAFGYSMEGFMAALKHPAFRIEVIVTAIMLPIGLILGHGPAQKILLVMSLLIVLMVELLNTGIEAAIDRISKELHPLSKFAKDVGSAAVLLSLINAGITWLIVLLG